ncbi:unnamed protein product [Urochloa humidicola]
MCAPVPASLLQLVTQDPQQANFSCPIVEYLAGLNPELAAGPSCYTGGSSNNSGTSDYHAEEDAAYYNEEGPSNANCSGGELIGGTDNVVELASREFMMPSSDDEVTLDFIRCK